MTEKLTPEEKAARKSAKQSATSKRQTSAAQRERDAVAAERFNPRSTPASVEESLTKGAMTADEYRLASERGLTGPESEVKKHHTLIPPDPRETSGKLHDVPDAYQMSDDEIEVQQRREETFQEWWNGYEWEPYIDDDTWQAMKDDEAEIEKWRNPGPDSMLLDQQGDQYKQRDRELTDFGKIDHDLDDDRPEWER